MNAINAKFHVTYNNGEAVELMMPIRRDGKRWVLPALAWDRIKEATIKPLSTLAEAVEACERKLVFGEPGFAAMRRRDLKGYGTREA